MSIFARVGVVLGVLLIALGASLVYPPAGVIVFGLGLIGLCLFAVEVE